MAAIPIEGPPLTDISFPRIDRLEPRGGSSKGNSLITNFLTGGSSKSSSSSKGSSSKSSGSGGSGGGKRGSSYKSTNPNNRFTMKPWREGVDDTKTAWYAGPVAPSGLQHPADECLSLAHMAYDELMGRKLTFTGQSRHLKELSTQENLVVACLYIPNDGHILSSQWVTTNMPPIDSAPAWKRVVYERTPERQVRRWDAEDMACIKAEQNLARSEHRLHAGEQYPEGSLVRIWARFGVNGQDGQSYPCTDQNDNSTSI